MSAWKKTLVCAIVPVILVVLSCVLYIGIKTLVSPADTFVCGYQVRCVRSDSTVGQPLPERYENVTCVIMAASSDMILPGNIVEFEGPDRKPVFGVAYEIKDDYSVVVLSDTGEEIVMPADAVKGIVVRPFRSNNSAREEVVHEAN